MSRCFPFPPPGYEKKARSSTEQGDLLAKEKHRERKHKKRKDKERGENKERKDKDRSKDKHKEKDKKEKHKDKKKDKERDREKDKNKTTEDRRTTEYLSEVHHEDRLGYDSRKAVGSRDSKFTEDFGRRIRDDEKGAATRMVEDSSATAHRRGESMGASTDIEKESVAGNKMVKDVTSTVQRRNEKLTSLLQKRTEDIGAAITMDKQKIASSEKVPDFNSAERRKNENVIHSTQKRIQNMGTAISMEKQRAASNDKFGAVSSADRGRNHATGRPMDNIPSSFQGRIGGKFTVDSVQKERVAINNMVPNSTGAAAKRNNGMERPTECRPLESLTESVSGRIENIGTAPAMEKERSLYLNASGTEQRRNDAMGPSFGKDASKNTEGKEKTNEKKAEDGKREGHKDRDREEKKRKEKDKERRKEKKKEEKKREKGEHKLTKHENSREIGVTDQIDNLINNTLAPYIEDISNAGADGNTKKRKEFESNGFLHEPQNDARPNKLPRSSASCSHVPVENGRPLGYVHKALPCDAAKVGAVNNMKIEKGLDDNGNHLNGMMVAAQSKHTLKPPIVPDALVDSSKNDQLLLKPPPPSKSDKVPVKPPHPDTKYLNTICSVPKAEELLEPNDQEWLFSSEHPRSNTNLEIDAATPQVQTRIRVSPHCTHPEGGRITRRLGELFCLNL